MLTRKREKKRVQFSIWLIQIQWLESEDRCIAPGKVFLNQQTRKFQAVSISTRSKQQLEEPCLPDLRNTPPLPNNSTLFEVEHKWKSVQNTDVQSREVSPTWKPGGCPILAPATAPALFPQGSCSLVREHLCGVAWLLPLWDRHCAFLWVWLLGQPD